MKHTYRTNGVLVAISLATLACAVLTVLAACLDVTPLVVDKDAGGVNGTPCLDCLRTPEGCLNLIDECNANDPRCPAVIDCMTVKACLDLPTLDDKIKCGLPCAQEAGVVTVEDPLVDGFLLPLVHCGQVNCTAPCGLVDASVNL